MRLTLTFVLMFLSVFVFAQETELPDLKLKNLDGKEVNLEDYGKNGKITIISFWATWCRPCKEELDNINELLPEWRDKYGVELLAISIDNSRNIMKVKPYVEGKGWDFEVLLDVNEDTKRALNFAAVPYTLVIDEKGKIVFKHSGYYEGDEYELEDKIIAISKKQ